MNEVLAWLRGIDPMDVLKWSTVIFLLALQVIAIVTIGAWAWGYV